MLTRTARTRLTDSITGFTLIEVVIVIIIAGVLATVALRSASFVTTTARFEETRHELDLLADAIVGNPDLHINGARSDFGYVGDVGALPPNLEALRVNPGGLGTWKGPYIMPDLIQSPADFKTDAWGSTYAYAGGVDITSSGSGEPLVRRLAGSTADLLLNTVSGIVTDADGDPPSTVYEDSIEIALVYPDGTGGLAVAGTRPSPAGFFSFDSIPVGNHDLYLIWEPLSDTTRRFVSVLPASSSYQEYALGRDLWMDGTGNIGTVEFIANSDTLRGHHCSELTWLVVNVSSETVPVTSLTISWASPTAWFTRVQFNGATAYNGAALRSGDTAVFDTPATIGPGETAVFAVGDFRENANGGGAKIDMTGVEFAVEVSDGSAFSFVASECVP